MELTPRPKGNRPARRPRTEPARFPTADGVTQADISSMELGRITSEAPTFSNLARRMTILTVAALALSEGLWRLRRNMERDARDCEAIAAECVQAEVEPRFVNLVTEAAQDLHAVAAASGQLAQGSADMSEASKELSGAHQREYGGIYRAVQNSGVQQAKPGFYR